MDWLDLYVWQDAARDYLSVLDGNNKQATETISRLHSVIADIDINNIGKTLEQFNVNQTDIISDVDGWINTAQSLVERIGQNLPQFKSIDEKISEVFKFCNHLHDTLSFERDIFLIPRLDTDPTQGDEDAGERLKSYLNGDYGDIDFTLFYNQFINISLLGTIAADDFDPEYHALLVHAERRRLNHLINICTDEHIKNTLSEMLDGIQHDIDTYYHVTPPIPDAQIEPTPRHEQPQASPSTEATATKVAPPSPSVDAERLKPFFNAKFKGMGNNYNYFDDMINDIERIKVTKELAMIAVMIYNCRSFIQRPTTFAAWLREFFEIIGRDCPKEKSKNKYQPSDKIKRMFHYLA